MNQGKDVCWTKKPARHNHECGAPLTDDCDNWCEHKYKGWRKIKQVKILTQALLEAADSLDEAAEDVSDWGSYASSYFQDKHNLTKCISGYQEKAAAIRDLIKEYD